MSDNSRADGSQDPLETYRQALRRQQTGGTGFTEAVEQPPPPEEPPAVEDQLELDEPLAAKEPPTPVKPLPAEQPPAPDKPRSAAEWLGLDEMLAEEDPLALEATAPAAPEAAPEAALGAAEADDSLPDELQDTLARYQRAMSKLRQGRGAEAPDPLAAPPMDSGVPSASAEPEAGGGDLLNNDLQDVDRRQIAQDGAGGATARTARAATVSGETLNQFRNGPAGRSDAPAADELPTDDLAADDLPTDDLAADDLAAEVPARGIPTKVRVAPPARRRARLSPAGASGWRIRAMTFGALLLAALPVQWLVYTRLGATFALEDLGVGLSALLPAALILLLARPVSGKGRLVMVVGSAAVALLGSAGFAYGLALLQNQLPQGASLVFGLLLTLGLFTAVWGPLFLILVPILSRTSLPARSGS
jgi:hypothetical protein